jgi:uncharacterized protein YqeY
VSATALKQRLRGDLKAAMQARAADEVRVLRTLIAALDNAEAVAVEGKPDPFRKLGDPSGEVPRRELDVSDVEALLQLEVESRLSAAADYERHGRGDDAAKLRGEAELVGRYRA